MSINARRRKLLAGTLCALAAPRSLSAPPPGRTIVVGMLIATSEAQSTSRANFVPAFAKLGYVEGRNLVIEWRYANNQYDRLDGLAAELVAKKVDAIVAGGTPPTLAAHKATKTTPIISVGGSSPVSLGLASNLARPDRNVTGIVNMGGEVFTKGMGILRRLVPGARRVGLLANPDNPANAVTPKYLANKGKEVGVELVGITFREAADLERELGGAHKGRVDAIYVRLDATLNVNAEKIAAFALARRIPSVGSVKQYVPAGGLASYGQSYAEQSARVADYVDRIANGAKVADLPIIQPTKFELNLNRATAKALGVEIPGDLLLAADLVVD